MIPDTKRPALPTTTRLIGLAPRAGGRLRDTCSAPVQCRLMGAELLVPAFRLRKFGQTFVSPTQVTIDLRRVEPGRYRLMAVHNFHLEDSNPNLSECLAGVFLARQYSKGTWAQPETYPVECRAIQVLAELEVAAPAPWRDGA